MALKDWKRMKEGIYQYGTTEVYITPALDEHEEKGWYFRVATPQGEYKKRFETKSGATKQAMKYMTSSQNKSD